jgi:hypothetical protein
VAARKEILSARFASGIRDRVQRYVNQEYPAQVALAARLVAPKPSPAPAPSGSPTVIPAAPVHQVEYIPSKNLQPKCALAIISSVPELDQWLAALRAAAEAELNKGNIITL